MPWEKVERSNRGKSAYGPGWDDRPAVAINASGLTFNAPFREVFSLRNGAGIDVLLDKKAVQIGFIIHNPAGQGHYKLAFNRKNRRTCINCACKAPAKAFPHALARGFFASLQDGIIVIRLDDGNSCDRGTAPASAIRLDATISARDAA